jgi:hypothetical protein
MRINSTPEINVNLIMVISGPNCSLVHNRTWCSDRDRAHPADRIKFRGGALARLIGCALRADDYSAIPTQASPNSRDKDNTSTVHLPSGFLTTLLSLIIYNGT